MFKILNNGLKTSKKILSSIVQPGDVVVDATAGKGHDTLFLAQLVGTTGKVYAFDVQPEAITSTRDRLITAEVEERVVLINNGHESVDKYVEEPIKAAMFNLGYLPGGNHSIITLGQTTTDAIAKILWQLVPGGVITIVVYYGHSSGQEEKDYLLKYIEGLDNRKYSVIKIDYPNRPNNPPFVVIIEKANLED
jgi:predicted methyltransferase